MDKRGKPRAVLIHATQRVYYRPKKLSRKARVQPRIAEIKTKFTTVSIISVPVDIFNHDLSYA